MESLQTEDGQFFIRSLAQFIRQHEKALANSLQLAVHKRQNTQNAASRSMSTNGSGNSSSVNTNSTTSLASALSFAGLNFMSSNVKSAHLTLTPHHLFYLLSRIEDLGVSIGPMNVRIESIHSEPAQSNYVSFLQTHKLPKKGRSDADSVHSVSSVRSVMSGMSSFWSSIGLGPSLTKTEKARAAIEGDLKYLYSAFTKLPSLRLTADPRARLIQGYEEFPFDTAVPLFAFKNVQQLDIIDMDFRQFHGWDRLADQLCLLTVKRGSLDDPTDLLTNIVLDDAERRRRRSTRHTSEVPSTPSWTVPSTPSTPFIDLARSHSDPGSPGEEDTPSTSPVIHDQSIEAHVPARSKSYINTTTASGNQSPKRPTPTRPASSYRHSRTYSSKIKRSGSGSSNSSDYSSTPHRSDSTHNMLGGNTIPSSKWQRLKYLSLADNALTSISASSIAPLTSSLRSFNLSSNLFAEIPDSLSTLTRLTSLDLSNCMIESLHSLSRSPLPAITTIKLKSNRLQSLAGVERLLSLENLHVQDNLLADPMEAARLTGIPNLRRIWVKQNPMAKKSDYRVKIMNLFRQTPGYLDDISIDDTPATYAERKMLVQRVPETERTSVTTPSKLAESPIIVQRALPTTLQEQRSDETLPVLSRQESNNTSSRRRKGTHRRIVDLAANGTVTWDVENTEPNLLTVTALSNILPDRKDEIKSEVPPALSDTSELDLGPSESSESVSTPKDQHDDEYRIKVEALRQQFGNNWLHALGEQHWYADQHLASEAEQQQQQQHSKIHLMGNPLVVTGARSLG